MAADELTRALLVEEVAAPRNVAEALFASVTGSVPLLQALVDSGATTPDILARYLARTEAPYLRQVVPLVELVDRLPHGLCARLLAIPVRRDPITGTVDVVVANPGDPHPADEIGFHLGTPVRVVRSSVGAIEEALRRLRMRAREDNPVDRFREAAARAAIANRTEKPPEESEDAGAEHPDFAEAAWRSAGDADRSPRPPAAGGEPRVPRRGGLVIEMDSVPPPAELSPAPPARIRTPPWGTPIHRVARPSTEPPKSGYGSEIPIPLTRKTIGPGPKDKPAPRGGRPDARRLPPSLGEGYAFDPTGLRDIIEKGPALRPSTRPVASAPPGQASLSASPGHPSRSPGAGSSHVSFPAPGSLGSFIPGPPPLPATTAGPVVGTPGNVRAPSGPPVLPFPDMGGVLAALRNAGSRDEILDLILAGARMVAVKVALFVVKKGGYHGWVGSPEFAERPVLQSVVIPLDANSIFDRAVHEDLYLGPIRYDETHAPLLRIMRNPSRDVAAVPVRVSGKTAVIILADELGDTMVGTRRLEQLAKAAGDSFARIVRTKR